MQTIYLIALAIAGGILLSLQSLINARLSILLQHPLLTCFAMFLVSSVLALISIVLFVKNRPSWEQLQEIPSYFWITGASCSLVGVLIYYYCIPRLGIGLMISLGLGGQVLLALVAEHFGWFAITRAPITGVKLLGFVCMLLGIFLIKMK